MWAAVLAAGLTAGPIGNLLGVRLRRRDTVAILGAQTLGLALGEELSLVLHELAAAHEHGAERPRLADLPGHDRVRQVVSDGRYVAVLAGSGRIFGLDGLHGKAAYLRPGGDATGRGRGFGRGGDLKTFDMASKKESTMLAGVRGYQLTADGKKMLVRTGSGTSVVDASTSDWV